MQDFAKLAAQIRGARARCWAGHKPIWLKLSTFVLRP